MKACPLEDEEVQCHTNSDYKSCPSSSDYSTKLYLKRYCLPTNSTLSTYVLEKYASGDWGKYIGDLATAWWVLLVMLGISTVIAMIYLFLLRCVAKPLLYISFFLILGFLAGGGGYVWALSDNY